VPAFVSLWLLLFSAHTLFWPTLWTSTSLSSNFSQNESCGWLQLPDSIQFAQNPFKLDFNPKQLVCKYPKTYFRVIPLFPWMMKVYNPSYPIYLLIWMVKIPINGGLLEKIRWYLVKHLVKVSSGFAKIIRCCTIHLHSSPQFFRTSKSHQIWRKVYLIF